MIKKRTHDGSKKAKVKDLNEKFSEPASTYEKEMSFTCPVRGQVTQKMTVKVYPLSEGKLTKISQEEKAVLTEEPEV